MSEHGQRSTYVNGKCGCAECCAANTAYTARRRKERKALLAAGLVEVTHGSDSTYTNWGCRCDPCTAAHTAAYNRRRKRCAF